MKKQTAIEWLIEQWPILVTQIPPQLINEAKAMEKVQIVDACNLQRNDYKGMPTYNKSGEQYYEEIYGGDK